MRGNRNPFKVAMLVVVSALLSLSGCGGNEELQQGAGPRSTMSAEEASTDRLEQFSQLVAESDAEGLEAEFSGAARENQDDLSARSTDLMSVIGGGTVTEGHSWMSVGTFAGGTIYVVSVANVTAPDGSKWQLHITDCTMDLDEPSEYGIKAIEAIPNTDRDAPRGFGWFNQSSGAIRYGIRFIRSWDGWDPYTSPNSPDW